TAVDDKGVMMDFNHPMAGKTLHFTGKVEGVREATEKELKEGLHGEYLPPEDGCGHCHKGECHKGEGECHKGEGDCCGCDE
ncbi:MAG: peptidylprolyl isomerase, partial [Bacteroidales bacterium]|nr:peptidylprolyl isomerase [Bacteroidales bacterium]